MNISYIALDMYSILIEDNFGMGRDELMKELEKKGIETRTFFIPIEGLHPLYPCVQLTDRLIYVSKANVRCKRWMRQGNWRERGCIYLRVRG